MLGIKRKIKMNSKTRNGLAYL